MKPSIHVISIADGFADDCDDLIQKCLQTDVVNYQVFCNIWKASKFALTFQGRASGAELAEVSEEFIHIAKRYMVRNTSNFEETVVGLFLVYALLHTQPYTNFAKLRITPEDLSAINLIEEVARLHKRIDVLYILGSLLIEGPVEYHLCEKEYGLENALKKGFSLTSSIDSKGVRPKGVFCRQNEELDMIRELACLERRYFTAKGLIRGTYREDKTLDYVDKSMASDMVKSLKELINGREYQEVIHACDYCGCGDARSNEVEDDIDIVGAPPVIEATALRAEMKNRGDDMQSIKQRAMRGTVGELRHLKTTGNSSQMEDCLLQTTTSNDGEPSFLPKQPPKPKKPQRQYKKKHPRWQKKKKDTFDSDSNLDINDIVNMPALMDDTDSVIAEKTSEEADTISKNNNYVDKQQSDIMIDIDVVPVETNSENVENSYIEIEIIDEYRNGGENTTDCEESTRSACDGDTVPDKNSNTTNKGKGRGKKSKPVDTELGYTQKGSQNNENVIESTQSETAGEIFGNIEMSKQNNEDTQQTHNDLKNGKIKVPNGRSRLRLKKLSDLNTEKSQKLQERKDLKKTLLKSKLKRLGILPVADLHDPVTENSPKKKRKPA